MPEVNLERVILKSLLYNEGFVRKVLPFLKEDYFDNQIEKQIFKDFQSFFLKYNSLPSTEAMRIIASESDKMREEELDEVQKYYDSLEKSKDIKVPEEWILNKTEKFCQEMAVHNALVLAVSIDAGEVKNVDRGMIPKILTDALSVCFDSHVGHDWNEDSEDQFNYYHLLQNHIPFDLQFFNSITNGGLLPKTLNVIMGGVGVGKTHILCHMASSFMTIGKNVLYITLEISEEEITKRIDANLLNIEMDLLSDLPLDVYLKKHDYIIGKTSGKLIIKEYPTASAHVGHFRHLLNELLLKKSFKPDILIVDYINICVSSRMKKAASDSYEFVKAISEELRGLGVEFGIPVLSATQLNRAGSDSSSPSLKDVSESFGLPMTADLMLAAIRSDELDKLNQILFILLKTRYGDSAVNKKFVVGSDRKKMRLYDVEQNAQTDIVESGQLPVPQKKFGKEKFLGFKFNKEDPDLPW